MVQLKRPCETGLNVCNKQKVLQKGDNIMAARTQKSRSTKVKKTSTVRKAPKSRRSSTKSSLSLWS